MCHWTLFTKDSRIVLSSFLKIFCNWVCVALFLWAIWKEGSQYQIWAEDDMAGMNQDMIAIGMEAVGHSDDRQPQLEAKPIHVLLLCWKKQLQFVSHDFQASQGRHQCLQRWSTQKYPQHAWNCFPFLLWIFKILNCGVASLHSEFCSS